MVAARWSGMAIERRPYIDPDDPWGLPTIEDQLQRYKDAFDAGNPLAAWMAWDVARHYELSIPEWVLRYLDDSALRLTTAPDDPDG